jgi:ferredoxin-NADP reductase
MGMPQKIRCAVVRITDHGGRVYTLDLKPERPVPQFLPGQFMHLAIDPYEFSDFWPESRVFSIASAPTQRDNLCITYSVVGTFTTKMEQRIQVGTQVWVKLPYGDFVIQRERDVVLIAGGTGITAFTAFLDGLTPNNEQQVTLFYGARNRELLIFRSMVEQKRKDVNTLSVWYFVEEGEQAEDEQVLLGRINLQSILPRVHNPQNSDFYLSGPPAMLNKMSSELIEKAIPSENIKTDAWA